MRTKVSKSRRSFVNGELRSSVRKTVDESLEDAIESLSLRDVPLEARRREASKPLFLERYE